MPKSRVSAEPNGLFRTGSRQTVQPCTRQLPWDCVMEAAGSFDNSWQILHRDTFALFVSHPDQIVSKYEKYLDQYFLNFVKYVLSFG